MAEFRVLVNHRVQDGHEWIDGAPAGHNVKVYGRSAEDVVEQLRQGSRVIVISSSRLSLSAAIDEGVSGRWRSDTQGRRQVRRRADEARHDVIGPQPISRDRLAGRATLLLSALGQPCGARAWLVAHSSA